MIMIVRRAGTDENKPTAFAWLVKLLSNSRKQLSIMGLMVRTDEIQYLRQNFIYWFKLV